VSTQLSQPPNTEARLRQLEQLVLQHGWSLDGSPSRQEPRRGKRRLLTVITSVVLAIGLPMLAIASDNFTDVPNSNPFHGNINNVYNARVASGCGAAIYCPKANVTREQMAAFLNRGLGRVGGVDTTTSTASELRSIMELDTFTIRPGDVSGGTVYLLVTGNVSPTTTAAGVCPCGLSVWVEVDGVQTPNGYSYETIPDVGGTLLGGGGWRSGSATVTRVVQVTSGATHTVSLNMDLGRTVAGSIGITYQLAAMYMPFGPGGNTTPAVAPAAVTGSDKSLSPAAGQ
jgi:hypothetical protein